MATNNNFSTYLYQYQTKKVIMENLDLIIFSVILVILFILFIIGTLIEFNRMGNEPYDAKKDKGGVVSLKNFIGKFLGS
jgi:hypothetical protein